MPAFKDLTGKSNGGVTALEVAEKIEDRLEESEVTTLYEFLDELSELEEKKED
ncbi:hypothetical protein NSB25_12720 [Acetatifactor muris]|uniref:Uncharacterized protein n=1 Tax=Acetatifactor muris TaxID=879566 RepID=A0A2K4ZHZ2_9FIRM|nr:hypothetical protein [Acetatifactor muris]MCR2048151.1 hypothetical protein [Acetatifactor muris]SOY30085.1 hypothetical protein AMURIS_02808 [Acetatifactor muris]